MHGRTGTSTIYTTILPKQSYLDKICTKKLSKEVKHRNENSNVGDIFCFELCNKAYYDILTYS